MFGSLSEMMLIPYTCCLFLEVIIPKTGVESEVRGLVSWRDDLMFLHSTTAVVKISANKKAAPVSGC